MALATPRAFVLPHRRCVDTKLPQLAGHDFLAHSQLFSDVVEFPTLATQRDDLDDLFLGKRKLAGELSLRELFAMRRPAWIIGDVAELSLSQLDPLGFGHGTAKARILGMFGRQVVYRFSRLLRVRGYP